MKKNKLITLFYWLLLAVFVFLVDIVSKLIIHTTFELYESINFFPFFSFTYVRNIGAAFSILEGQRWLLALIAIVISGVIIYMIYRNGSQKKLESFSLALILGGALGNLFDRLYHGYVIDFLDFHIDNWHYPVFNLADCAICLGIVLFIFSSYRDSKKQKQIHNQNNQEK